VDVVVFASNGGNFCSGGDVHDIIGPLIGMPMKDLLAFTRMTGDLVKAMISCGKPIIAAVDGVAVGAGAIIAMASDLRLATPGGEMRVPVHPRRAGGLRHGGLRHAAADHRAGPGGGTAVHRAGDEGR
jgi:enoyl-CoA hydratase/carnithine racemase